MKREIVFSKDKMSLTRSMTDILGVVQMWIGGASTGTWVLKMEKKPVQRSISQNALMWIWFDAIAKEWTEATDRTYTKDMVKEMFTAKYLPMETPMGIVGKSTSTLSVDEMAEFLTKVQAHAASEWGISLLSPQDKMFYEWQSQYE